MVEQENHPEEVAEVAEVDLFGAISDLKSTVEGLGAKLDAIQVSVPSENPHILHGTFEKFSEIFDKITASKGSRQQKLEALQDGFETFALEVADRVKEDAGEDQSSVHQQEDQMSKILETLSIMSAKIDKLEKGEDSPLEPVRRSYRIPTLKAHELPSTDPIPGKPSSISAAVRRSVITN